MRWMLPLIGLVMVGCASTTPLPTETIQEQDLTQSEQLPPRSDTESVDKHLFDPSADGLNADSSADLPLTHDSVYLRMMASFALPDCNEHEISRTWAQWYGDRPEYMARVLKRAEPWIWFIVDEIERRGMPGELALLPIVESAYDPFAYSSGRALGAWQFVSATGREYGLQQNWWYDGRRDVWASTYAALDYLEYLHKRFDGDWMLALASYNSGQGRVSRSVARNLKAGKPGDFWNIKLPRETRGYVPKLLGLTCLFLNADQYQYQMPDTPDRQVLTSVDFDNQTDLVLVSQAAGVPIDVLFTLNPGYNRWATAPEGPHHVVLPLDAAKKLELAKNDLGAEGMMKWDQVTVQPGDSLSKIASVHQVPVSVLRTANDLDGDLIRVGQKLRLPRDQQSLVDPLYASAAAELAQLQSGLLASDRKTHTVRSGENLSVIAKRYRVTVRELQAWNKISNPRMIRPGQKLTVFMSPAQQSSGPKPSQYTVRSGDSLWSIARKHKVKLNDLMRWNGLNSASVLRPGQNLKLVF